MTLNENNSDNTLNNAFYITTAIAYTNDKPHIGFVLELIQADVLARWNILKGKDTFFLTGTDEHGTKNWRSAKEANVPVEEFVAKNASRFQDLKKEFNLSNNDFIRTTDKKRHYPTAQKIWTILKENGDLYKKNYVGYYCTGCESFKTERDLIDGKCPDHDKKPEIVEEENYFFKLSKYTDKIIELIESDILKVIPKTRKNEIISLLTGGLDDVSFSRSSKNLKWGIPVPEDPAQIMYVWCDALTNYLSGIGYTTDKEKFNKYWSNVVHVIGKDIIKFHLAYWPAMLLSANLSLPKKVLVHGFMTIDGKKMSKTLGNVVDPVEQKNKYGVDQLRYFLMREIPSGDDGNYSESLLEKRINSDLADGLGNLVNRSVVMAEKYYRGKVPAQKINEELAELAKETVISVDGKIEGFELHHALQDIWKLVNKANAFINERRPWENKEGRDETIYTLLETLRVLSGLLWPFIPETSEKILEQLSLKREDVDFFKLKEFGFLQEGTELRKGEILFKKIDS